MRFILSLLALGLASTAQANMLTPSLSLFYFTQGSKRDVTGSAGTGARAKYKETTTWLNLGLCYNMDGICLGLKYLQGEIEHKNTTPSGSSTGKETYTGPAVTIGWSSPDGLVAHGSLMLNGKKTVDGGGTVFPMKSGYILELGYGFKVSSVRMGPLLGYSQFTYSKVEVNGHRSELKPSMGDEFLMPQLALWVDL